uniref:PseudoU_synth_2 domain-containing protein n=1 Tax=Macrostomum lignano TaxID=282301 RepID=A0A1I8FH69_9PLAT
PNNARLFHKPFRVKSHAKAESTERRQTCSTELRRCYQTAFAYFPEATRRKIRTARWQPEVRTSSNLRLWAHTDADGFVYFAAPPANYCTILVKPPPTVYALWRAPLMSNGACVDAYAASGLLSLAALRAACGLLAQFVAVGRAAADRGRAGKEAEAGAGPYWFDHVAQLSEEMGAAASVDSSCNNLTSSSTRTPARRDAEGAGNFQPSLTYVDRGCCIGVRRGCVVPPAPVRAGEGPLTIEDCLFRVTCQQRGGCSNVGPLQRQLLDWRKQVRQFDYGVSSRRLEGLPGGRRRGHPGPCGAEPSGSQCGRLCWRTRGPGAAFRSLLGLHDTRLGCCDCHGAVLLATARRRLRAYRCASSRAASNKCVSAGRPARLRGGRGGSSLKTVSAVYSRRPPGGGSGEVVSVQGDQLAYLYRLLTEDYQIS